MDAFNLVRGICPECGSKFKDDKDRPMMLVCTKCPYEIDTVTYFEVVEELYPPASDIISDDPDGNLKKLSKL